MNLLCKPGYQATAIGPMPLDWTALQLDALADIDSESLSNNAAADFEFRYISLGDVDAGKLVNGKTFMTFAEAPSRARRKVRAGDVLFATVRPNLKGHYFARDVFGDVIASTGFAVVRAKEVISSSAFLYQSLLSSSVDKQIRKLIAGSNYPAVNSVDVKGLCIAVPPLPEQKKIATVLSTVDDKLDVINRQIAASQSLKQGLMQTLLVRGVGTQDTTGRWVLHADFKDSELGEIPPGWSVKAIGEALAVVERPIKMVDDQRYRRVTVKRRHGGVTLRDELPGASIKVKNQFLLEAGDFLISERQIVHGACGIVPGYLEGALVSNEYLVLRARDGFDSNYFNYLVQLPKYAKLFLLCSQGVDIEKFLFKPKDWLKKKIPVPPLAEQQRIAHILAAVDAKTEVLQGKQSAYQALKRGLMQKLLTGEWRVKLDEVL